MKGCCVSQTQPEGVWPTGNSRSEAGIAGHLRLEDVQSHDVARGIVQDQIQVLEVHDAVQPLRQFVEQLAEIAVLGNRFGHFQQGLDAALPKKRRGVRGWERRSSFRE